ETPAVCALAGAANSVDRPMAAAAAKVPTATLLNRELFTWTPTGWDLTTTQHRAREGGRNSCCAAWNFQLVRIWGYSSGKIGKTQPLRIPPGVIAGGSGPRNAVRSRVGAVIDRDDGALA